ncbi:Gfo/Idh/MocA family protein [Dysgonomonas sp. 25]|uniref:Gfo/Idh/MocA family protein n=1 Tax=Dysgonomonas sp. 25 TaxID=2302933 RepID=UPI0013D086BF|nr:Gfo/Idh/MocA family oxidoreductase [Dysgonomonas sp. 25]NDV67318.1 gfo/Idh/MocA family oxidoreductase [Dysgonomonas sp. 25]
MNKNRIFLLLILLVSLVMSLSAQKQSEPLRLAVAGVSHGHIWEVVSRIDRGDFTVVGVYEQDDFLRKNNGLVDKVANSKFYGDLSRMLDETKPEVVVAYGSIYDHLSVVEACAPRGIHVMVEKPLAVNKEHATRITELARKHNIKVLTNYETTWYSTNHEAYRMIKEQGRIGEITRINIYDGHEGPIEIGCGKEFTDWLTDPVLNGGGAVIDFGCYGANLATWLFDGEKPLSVYAVLKTQKPDIYPKVDDDATIMLEYPKATVEIMASWNWPMSRKDMHIYGSKGYICQDTPTAMRVGKGNKVDKLEPAPLAYPYNDSFYYLKAVVRGDIPLEKTDLSSIDNNLIVVEILQAAIESARTGCAVKLQ